MSLKNKFVVWYGNFLSTFVNSFKQFFGKNDLLVIHMIVLFQKKTMIVVLFTFDISKQS